MVEDEEEEIIKEEEGVLRIEEASSVNIIKRMNTMNLNVELVKKSELNKWRANYSEESLEDTKNSTFFTCNLEECP